MRRLPLCALALGLSLALGATARAETITLDGADGTDYDSVGDGWMFAGPPPTPPPPDGTGDAADQPLGVALITGVLELRAMAEFPLASISSLTAEQIESAKVTFAIDDVLGTFGPGASFNGEASSPIAVYHYPADGTVTTGDFAPAGLAQLGIAAPGLITDGMLLNTGPVVFEVDATQKVKDALTAGDGAFGVLFGTTDSPTGTSLDGLSPPGVPGGHLPFLTIETAPLVPPLFTKAEQTCQGVIAKESGVLLGKVGKAFATCFGAILKDWEPDQVLHPKTTTSCEAQIDPTLAKSVVAKAMAKFSDKIGAKCAGLAPSDVGSPCNPSAAALEDTIACLQAKHLSLAQEAVASQYTSACTLLSSVGLASDYPEVCAP
jgi:hypothetical protein